MSAILLAVSDGHPVAERVRVSLVRDGFPTDRVELTASCEPGRAGLGPANSPHDKFIQYFGVLFTRQDQRHYAEQLAECVEKGAVPPARISPESRPPSHRTPPDHHAPNIVVRKIEGKLSFRATVTGCPRRSAAKDLPPHAPSIEVSTATRRRAARDRALLGSIPNSSSHTRMSAAQKAGP